MAAGCQSVETEIRELETYLNQLFACQLAGSKIWSRAKWLEEGEILSRYFFHLENEQYVKAFVSSVFGACESEVFSLPEIIDAHTAFYSSLFSLGTSMLMLSETFFPTYHRV